MKTIIFYQARIVGVHELINFYWTGADFKESEAPIVLNVKDAQEEFRVAAYYMDIRVRAGLKLLGSDVLEMKVA